jgi:hypothetical protein
MSTAAPAYIAGSEVAYVFFQQVGLQLALHHSETVADHPTVPWSGRRVVKPYLLRSWSGPSGRRWDALVQSDDSSPQPCPGNAATCWYGQTMAR